MKTMAKIKLYKSGSGLVYILQTNIKSLAQQSSKTCGPSREVKADSFVQGSKTCGPSTRDKKTEVILCKA